MDPMEVLKAMQGISPDLLSDASTQQQMKSFWNMLDEMASNNPDVKKIQEYSKFIKSNLESGAEDIKLSSGKKKYSGRFSYCIKTYTKGKKQIVIINFCSCPEVLGPLDSQRLKADHFNLDSWQTIPASISRRLEKKVEGRKAMFYFDAFVHPCVIEAGLKDLRCKSHISSSVLKRLEVREQFSLTFDQGQFDYFETYKGPNGEEGPAAMFLEAAADPEEYSKFINRASAKEQFDELRDLTLDKGKKIVTQDILIKPKVEEIIEVKESKERKSLNVEEVKSVEKVKEENRKVMIEEIVNFKVCVNALKNRGKVEVDDGDKCVLHVFFEEEMGMANVEVDAAEKRLKVKSPSFVAEVEFLRFGIRDTEISAKWIKSKKKLVITCPKK